MDTIKCRVEADWHIYTLLPPHLAEQWRELRKAEDVAFKACESDAWNEHARCIPSETWSEFSEARTARIAFEKQHGIGGGA